MEEREIVIVGAGPAGTSTAEAICKNSDKDVLVLERSSEIGKPFTCAGGLLYYSFEKYDIEIPEELVEREVTKFKLRYGEESIFFDYLDLFNKPFVYTVDRVKFDKELARQAKEAGAEIRTNKNVEEVLPEADKVLVDGEEIGYGLLVGADGPTSIVRKQAGIDRGSKDNIYTSFQYVMETDFPSDKIIVHFDEEYSSFSYLWLFPIKGGVRIGTAVPLELGNPKEYVDNFLEDHPEYKGKIKETTGGLLNLRRPNKIFKNNTALVGDAAGFADPITGEGIGEAIVSGRRLGKTLAQDEGLDEYQTKMKDLVREVKFKYKVSKYFFLDQHKDELFDLIKELGDTAIHPINEKIPNWLQSLIIRTPYPLLKLLFSLFF